MPSTPVTPRAASMLWVILNGTFSGTRRLFPVHHQTQTHKKGQMSLMKTDKGRVSQINEDLIVKNKCFFRENVWNFTLRDKQFNTFTI